MHTGKLKLMKKTKIHCTWIIMDIFMGDTVHLKNIHMLNIHKLSSMHCHDQIFTHILYTSAIKHMPS